MAATTQGHALAHRLGEGAGVARGVELAVVVDVVLAQQAVEQTGELVEPVDPLPERAVLAEDPAVEVAPGPDAEQEAPPAGVVEGDGVASQRRTGAGSWGTTTKTPRPIVEVTVDASARVGAKAKTGESGRPPHTRWS